MSTSSRMPLVAALEVLRDVRRGAVVITAMGAAREWMKLSDHPLDLNYVPSSMGQAPGLGLGLALGLPEREVIVLNGDGCMLMNLGALVTIAAARSENYTLVVVNNGIYEVTGGQATAAAKAPTSFAELASAAGFTSVAEVSDVELWRSEASSLLAAPGPRFIEWHVEPVPAGDHYLSSPGPMPPRLQRFAVALKGAARPSEPRL